jgi:hypothetical protein
LFGRLLSARLVGKEKQLRDELNAESSLLLARQLHDYEAALGVQE